MAIIKNFETAIATAKKEGAYRHSKHIGG